MNSLSNRSYRSISKISIKAFFLFSFVVSIYNISCSVNKSATSSNNTDSLALAKTLTAQVDTEYYSKVEKPALFQNGDVNTFISYLKKNTKYPVAALKKKQQGTAIIQFGIDCYGAVKIFSIMKSSGVKLLDDESKRALNSSPKWTPAKTGNKSVGQLMVLQFKFSAVTRTIQIH